ncbi:putative transcription factor interactor and regulator CCHC(Zn) family [Helianthus annuus]|nr:putative transcription factor interactor and regulator CCHC(Zn) family [Helianthus annuus]KAJ0618021.1 putative transcription factor interactor and regulator CCHC(Zn) family [Helianthus annuus]
MSFLASILDSYESLVAGKIGNPNMKKEDYNQVDPEEMELMDIRWCMASVIRRAQCFMEITRRKCLEGPDMKLGVEKAKVTCFKCKQKGHFKRECTNNKVDDSVNPLHEDYYKKAIYHRNNEQASRTNQKPIEEGSSKERKQAYVTIQNDEGFNWNKYILKKKLALVAETRPSREERHARMELSKVHEIFMEASRENRWDAKRECFVDPQGNPAVDPQKVDFEALVAAIPTARVWDARLENNPNYRKEVEEGIRKVIYASVEKKKKTVEEIVDESQKMVTDLKKTTEKAGDEKLKSSAEEAVIEKEQMIAEDQN